MTHDTYADMGEFHDLFMIARWKQLSPALGEVFGHLTASDRLLDLGAGTGLGTRELAAVTAARITAIEPSLLQRAQLTARIIDDAELTQRVSVLSDPLPSALHQLPGPVDGFVAAHVLGHLDPGERRRSFASLRQVLTPGGFGLITMPQAAAASDDVASTHREELATGELTYVARYSVLDGDEYLNEYQVWRGDRILRSVASRGRWRYLSERELRAELGSVGFAVDVRADGLGVVRIA